MFSFDFCRPQSPNNSWERPPWSGPPETGPEQKTRDDPHTDLVIIYTSQLGQR